MARRRRSIPDGILSAVEQTIVPDPLPPLPEEKFTPFDAIEFRRLAAERASRQAEALRIYQQLPKIEIFHKTDCKIRLLIGSNRAGKSLGSAVEFARAITGQDPWNKYPKINGVAFVFGLDSRHIGNMIYKKVFRAGAFHMIRDEQTNLWRAYSPVMDAHRAHERKPAPPLVPPRFIKSISWSEKKAFEPKMIAMKNGWEIHFYSSKADLPQGQDIDLFWIDEEVDREDVIEELIPRCADRAGKGIWSATPQVSSAQLYDLHDRASSGEALTENASISLDGDVVEVHAHILDNPHIAASEKEKMFRGWNEEQRKVRWDGKFAFSSFLVYPEFSANIHAWPQNSGWQVPHEWSRYFSVDPGRERCAVTFFAVPPPHLGDFVVVYDELYIAKCDAEIFGRSVGAKSSGIVYEAATIDAHAGRVNEMGSGKNVEEQYRQALVRHGVHMRNSVTFTWGSDDVQAGLQAVRDWLRITARGQPRLFIHLARCPNLRWEFDRYRFKRDPKTKMPSDIPEKQNDHLMDTLRYMALHRPIWRKPKVISKFVSPAVNALKRKREKKRERDGSDRNVVHFGMGKTPK